VQRLFKGDKFEKRIEFRTTQENPSGKKSAA
jgi:hypothetical protein